MKNREIKFRAWTGAIMEYKVLSGSLGSFYVQGIDPRDAASLSPMNTKYHDKTPIMQFTGLFDKNRKEIYEGDLCEYLTARNGLTVGKIIYEQQACAFWFKWHDGAFHRYKELKATSGGDYFQADNLNIIGNIYENPELCSSPQ